MKKIILFLFLLSINFYGEEIVQEQKEKQAEVSFFEKLRFGVSGGAIWLPGALEKDIELPWLIPLPFIPLALFEISDWIATYEILYAHKLSSQYFLEIGFEYTWEKFYNRGGLGSLDYDFSSTWSIHGFFLPIGISKYWKNRKSFRKLQIEGQFWHALSFAKSREPDTSFKIWVNAIGVGLSYTHPAGRRAKIFGGSVYVFLKLRIGKTKELSNNAPKGEGFGWTSPQFWSTGIFLEIMWHYKKGGIN